MSKRPGARPYTADPQGPRSAIDAACRGALIALRPVLNIICIDLVCDYPWPEETAHALITLESSRRRHRVFPGREPDITADLDPSDDHQFAAALAIAPHTICATGITRAGADVYNADDSGYSTHFVLTDTELAVAAEYMKAQGADPAYLIPVTARR